MPRQGCPSILSGCSMLKYNYSVVDVVSCHDESVVLSKPFLDRLPAMIWFMLPSAQSVNKEDGFCLPHHSQWYHRGHMAVVLIKSWYNWLFVPKY